MLPLVILSLDIASCSLLFFGNTRARVTTLHVLIALSSLMSYFGYFGYSDGGVTVYKRVKMSGLLMIAFSLLFGAVLSPLFGALQSSVFSTVSNLIASVLIIFGIGFVLDSNDLDVNIAEWTLFLPICCLVAYELQLIN